MTSKELAKFLIYRTPIVRRLMTPSFPYKISPGQLAALVQLIEATKGTPGAVVEIGVAQGDTSVFLLEHLKSTNDGRKVLLFDTFSGFTKESVSYERKVRGKYHHFSEFRYGDRQIFEGNLRAAGYDDFQIFQGDASKFDWSSIAPIAVVHLDIDLYQPTIEILRSIWPHIVPGGGIVLDDCVPGTSWDGSLQAYEEFIAEHDFPFRRAGSKGGVLVKPNGLVNELS